MNWKRWITFILGIWFVISSILPYAFDMKVDMWNNVIMGLLIFVIGLLMLNPLKFATLTITIAGLWIGIISFVPIFLVKEVNLINSLAIGVIVLVFSLVQKESKTQKAR